MGTDKNIKLHIVTDIKYSWRSSKDKKYKKITKIAYIVLNNSPIMLNCSKNTLPLLRNIARASFRPQMSNLATIARPTILPTTTALVPYTAQTSSFLHRLQVVILNKQLSLLVLVQPLLVLQVLVQA